MTDTIKTWNTPVLVDLNSDLANVQTGGGIAVDSFVNETSGAN